MKKIVMSIVLMMVLVVLSFADKSHLITINNKTVEAVEINNVKYIPLDTFVEHSYYQIEYADNKIELTKKIDDPFLEYELISEASNKLEIKFASKDIYVGEFSNGKMNGVGTLYSTDDTSYNGLWEENVLIGKDAFISYYNGDYYIGETSNFKAHGNGKMTYANGDVYTGDFVYGHREGKGVMLYDSGYTYKGEWHNDIYNGIGRFTKNGQSKQGEWINGKFIKYVPTDEFGNRY